MEISKETILTIHGKLSHESKLELEKCFPDYFVREPLNGWKGDVRWLNWMGYWKNNTVVYFIDSLGNFHNQNVPTLATHMFIKNSKDLDFMHVNKVLFELAKSKGYAKGIRVEGGTINHEATGWMDEKEVFMMGMVEVLIKGVWSEIKPSIPQQKLQQLLEDSEFYRNVDFDTLEKLNAIKNTL